MIKDTLLSEMKEAMKAKDEFSVGIIRGVLAAVHNREIEKRSGVGSLGDDEVTEVIKKEAKKRKEAALLYREGNRADLAEKEDRENEFLSRFLPQMMSEKELELIIDEVVSGLPEKNTAQFGLAMKEVMKKTDGRAEGALVSRLLKQKLS